MRIASFVLNGHREVGLVSADGKTVAPLALTREQARKGVQAVIDLQAAGQALPASAGTTVSLSDVRLEAPLPLPRRNLWCVGRNYHAHAKELQASVHRRAVRVGSHEAQQFVQAHHGVRAAEAGTRELL